MFAGTICSGSQEKRRGKGKGESLAMHRKRQYLIGNFEYQKAKNIFLAIEVS